MSTFYQAYKTGKLKGSIKLLAGEKKDDCWRGKLRRLMFPSQYDNKKTSPELSAKQLSNTK
jgi:hypothetical protein